MNDYERTESRNGASAFVSSVCQMSGLMHSTNLVLFSLNIDEKLRANLTHENNKRRELIRDKFAAVSVSRSVDIP